MKLSLKKVFFVLLILQIFAVQGIITFNVFKWLGNWELKSFLHLASALLTILVVLLYRFNRGTINLSLSDILLIGYSIICVIVLSFNASDLESAVIAFREVLLVGLIIFAYQQIQIPLNYWDKILKLLYILVVANLFFIVLTHILGPEDYMKLLTGRYKWGNDTEYKFKISSFLYFWRSPGLIGSPGNVGYFGLLTYLLFDQNEKYKKKVVLPIILAIAGFVRSVYVVLVIYWVLKFFLTKKNLRIIKQAFPYFIPVFLIVGYFLYAKGVLDLTSLFMRIDHWVNDITVDYNVFLGLSIGEAGGAVRGDGFIATLDNYWLLMLISTGLVGVVLLIIFLYDKSSGNIKLRYALIGFLFAGLFVTLTQGISFLVLFPMLFLRINNLNVNQSE